jgi:pyruvate dehydrogenase E1 component
MSGNEGPRDGTAPTNVPILREGVASYLADSDPEETQEWMDSLDGLLAEAGPERARYLMLRLLERASKQRVPLPALTSTDYVNTIPTSLEPEFPGDEAVERTYRRWIRWNAAIMVHRAQRPGIGVGGHISTYAGAAPLYEVGYNHFFRGKDHPGGGDHIYFQGHASPGMYARAYLEGRLREQDLDGFRQEKSHPGRSLPSYPHPRSLPEFWEFPTVSMGLGPINAIYQARFNRYLHNRGIKDTSQQHVWAFLGDGEMDEVESRGALQIAANDALDNLTFVINCNLQRLDGPVRGNGQIVQELESYFSGAGWNVIKVVWGREWDALFDKDTEGALVSLMNSVSDGDYQTFRANDGAWIREARRGYDGRRDLGAAPRRARLPQDPRRVQGVARAHRPADGHPGPHHQGLRTGPELRGPQRDPPDEEADARRPQTVPRQAADPHHRRGAGGRSDPAALLQPGAELAGDPLHAGPQVRPRRARPRAAPDLHPPGRAGHRRPEVTPQGVG